jgi:hypothetical protein
MICIKSFKGKLKNFKIYGIVILIDIILQSLSKEKSQAIADLGFLTLLL